MNESASSSFRRPAGTDASEQALDDPRVFQAVQEYLLALEAGQKLSRQELLDRNPEVREPLARCLDALQLVHSTTRKAPMSGARLTRGLGPLAQTEPLGDFRIVREIGRGGMGCVYEAVQLSLGRRVALKVLPFAAAMDTKHLQRFKNEAQAAALLHHNHIVPVFGVGCERGIHFYAMQLIEGQTVAAIIRQLRGEAGRDAEPVPSGSGASPESTGPWLEKPDRDIGVEPTETQTAAELTTERSMHPRRYFRTVARLGVQAALALEHAHQNGVIHRDVKPGNLILDGRGHLWVTDFGLAQFHANASLTGSGDLLGTLRYMSPEQALGQRVLLDHRTDVYSLGVTLYEMLTLDPAFPANDRQELLRQLGSEEPRSPRSVDPTIPVELETIVLKAMSKAPADRYATAQALADDVQRFLDEKPILARRPTLIDRGRKWGRRHPSIVVASLVVLVTIIAGLSWNTWLMSREEAKFKAAYQNERDRTRKAMDGLIQVTEEELADKPFLSSVRKRLLETALVWYQDFMDQHQDDPELPKVGAKVQQILEQLSTEQGAFRGGLLNDPNVQKDLALSDAQLRATAQLRDQWHALADRSFRGFRQLSAEERHLRFLELARSMKQGLKDVLSASQLARLEQIDLQFQGLRAFHDPEIINALKLTTEQRAKIRDIEEGAFGFGGPHGPPDEGHGGRSRPPDDGLGGAQGGPPDKGHGKHAHHPPHDSVGHARDRMGEALSKVVALLTVEQKQRWNELIGKPLPRFHRGPESHDPPPGDDCPPP